MGVVEANVLIVHPTVSENGRWIDDFVALTDEFRFKKISPSVKGFNWHARGKSATLREWSSHLRQSFRAMNQNADVVVANFPQLTLCCCFWKTVLFRKTKVIGWSFNFGAASKSRFAPLVGRLFAKASLLVTHSRAEIDEYASDFGISRQIFRFFPYQSHQIEFDDRPESADIVAMGSAGRDYATLIAAVKDQNWSVVIIAKPGSLSGVDIPRNVTIKSDLTMAECNNIAASCAVMALPIAEMNNAAGQVTLVAAMSMKLPVLATRCPGTVDYISDGLDGLLIPHKDVGAWTAQLRNVLSDQHLRIQLAENAHKRWRNDLSDEAAGANLLTALRMVTKVAA